MTRIDDVHVPEPNAGDEREEAAREARQRRRNVLLLVVLVIIIATMMLASHPLFNNYWDPKESEKTISH